MLKILLLTTFEVHPQTSSELLKANFVGSLQLKLMRFKKAHKELGLGWEMFARKKGKVCLWIFSSWSLAFCSSDSPWVIVVVQYRPADFVSLTRLKPPYFFIAASDFDVFSISDQIDIKDRVSLRPLKKKKGGGEYLLGTPCCEQ